MKFVVSKSQWQDSHEDDESASKYNYIKVHNWTMKGKNKLKWCLQFKVEARGGAYFLTEFQGGGAYIKKRVLKI